MHHPWLKSGPLQWEAVAQSGMNGLIHAISTSWFEELVAPTRQLADLDVTVKSYMYKTYLLLTVDTTFTRIWSRVHIIMSPASMFVSSGSSGLSLQHASHQHCNIKTAYCNLSLQHISCHHCNIKAAYCVVYNCESPAYKCEIMGQIQMITDNWIASPTHPEDENIVL